MNGAFLRGDLASDRVAASARLCDLDDRVAALPAPGQASPVQDERRRGLREEGLALRAAFLAAHAPAVGRELTDDLRRPLGCVELLDRARTAFPGLVPDARRWRDECARPLAAKVGLDRDHAELCARLLHDPAVGEHLVRSATRPRPEAPALLARFRADDAVDLGPVRLERHGRAGHVLFGNHRYLNAEDEPSTDALELAVDLVLLDERCEVGVLRGLPATHERYRGRRVFGAGINLTDMSAGRITLAGFFLTRELGAVAKMQRGHTTEDPTGRVPGVEKPWVAAVETFAIGGGFQFLLVMDAVVAERGAYVNLPASREGIVPGCGPLRLPRFVGEAVARQAVLLGRDFAVEDPALAGLVTSVVEPERVAEEVDAVVERLVGEGAGSAVANRRMQRVGAEPVEVFRRYMAEYAREQAECLLGPVVLANLERAWRRHHDPARAGAAR